MKTWQAITILIGMAAVTVFCYAYIFHVLMDLS